MKNIYRIYYRDGHYDDKLLTSRELENMWYDDSRAIHFEKRTTYTTPTGLFDVCKYRLVSQLTWTGISGIIILWLFFLAWIIGEL